MAYIPLPIKPDTEQPTTLVNHNDPVLSFLPSPAEEDVVVVVVVVVVRVV